MSALTLSRLIDNILVVGPIYNKLEKLDEIAKLIPEYDWIIFNDGITHPNDNTDQIIDRLKSLDKLSDCGKIIYNKGYLDYNTQHRLDVLDPNHLFLERWLKEKPDMIIAKFDNDYKLVITSGGISPQCVSLDQVQSCSLQGAYLEHPHKTYSGGLGYVISNQPLTKWAPKYYPFSVQLGNTIDGQVYAIKINKHGIQRTIIV